MGTFGELLRSILVRRGLSERSFAIQAQSSKSSISGIVTGSRTPPLARIDTWCDILGLRGQDRQLFQDLAVLAHLPPPARERFTYVLEEYRRLKQDNHELQSQIRRAAET